jgi:hypothetical protein
MGNAEMSLTLEDYTAQAVPSGHNPTPGTNDPIGIFELFMSFYLKMLLPCADYFESLMEEHY